MGVMAAAQIGKSAVLLPALCVDLGLSLPQAAWATSSLEVGTASLSFAVAWLTALAGARNALLIGILVLTGSSIAEALVHTASFFLASRLVESVGYMLIVILGPSVMAFVADERDRDLAMVLWSTFLPIGFAFGFALSGLAVTTMTLGSVLLSWGAASIFLIVLWYYMPASANAINLSPTRSPRIIWIFSLSFTCFAITQVGVLVLLPTFLSSRYNTDYADTGLITAWASASGMLGGFVALGFLKISPAHKSITNALRWMFAVGTVASVASLFALFTTSGFEGSNGTRHAMICAIAFNSFQGLIPAVIFARLPHVVAKYGSSDGAGLVPANAALSQCGAVGSLVGPPLLAHVVGEFGWTALSFAAAFFSALSIILFFAFEATIDRTTRGLFSTKDAACPRCPD